MTQAPSPGDGAAVAARVREFYEQLPFNYEGADQSAVAQVQANPIRGFADLDALLRAAQVRNVVEVGCGTGWLTNSLALHYGVQVVAVDMTERALERARLVASRIGVAAKVRFVAEDLFTFSPPVKPDLAVSIGVLHHTHACAVAFRHVAGFVDRGGLVFIGLYHQYGRAPFLSLFREILAREGEDAALRRYRELNPGIGDETFLRSWFRDQVLHPHESQHTLEEVCGWLAELGFELRSTSLNRFEPFTDVRELFALEREQEEISRRRNWIEKRYFPGFFTILAERVRQNADSAVTIPDVLGPTREPSRTSARSKKVQGGWHGLA
jgi:SAM-dependent methyltransferase